VHVRRKVLLLGVMHTTFGMIMSMIISENGGLSTGTGKMGGMMRRPIVLRMGIVKRKILASEKEMENLFVVGVSFFWFWLRDCKVMYFEVGGRTLGYPGEREGGVDVEQQSSSYG
jgi:hypothetical protein